MIVYSLKCARAHEFEAWFRDSAAYETQRAKRAVACPECGDTKVSKAPMAPRVARRHVSEAPASGPPDAAVARKALESLRRRVEENCEYVGERFAEEARKIHYGEVAGRDIYGEASDDDARGLSEEGIAFQRIPWIRREDA